ncbi:MAG: carboxyl transferase domain-containing protein [Bacteroidota bacterium]|nr:carboxyl transferase domain-containing protein [Bacteroidota bacterium]MEC8757480.1 carboxyl transferase domain-containing protein [Bacteroidota bacterium]MEC9221663.1 carboxyl transferase domain-containing protein [Bacteroidota bacterium]
MPINESDKNKDAMKMLLSDLQAHQKEARLGGGEKSLKRHKAKGKMTARERIDALLDDPKTALEIGTLAGKDMYPEYGGCPSGGVVVKIGLVQNTLCVIVANDATVKAGAWFPITGKKNLRAQEIAMENHLPIIYLVDSAGVFLPMQDEIFPDKEHFGRIFRNNAVLSARGIPQIAAVMGSCVAGGAYLPIMSDEALIVEKTGSIFLAGSYLVKAAIGEDIDNETLGGAATHSEISGVTDYKMKDDEECLKTIRDLVGKLGPRPTLGFNREKPVKPKVSPKKAYEVYTENGAKPYKMIDLLETFIDADSFTEYKAGYGRTIITGYARIDGWSVGIVANNRELIKNKSGEMQFGGVIYSDSADKAARFVMVCNQKRIPLVFVQDVTGFMVGSRSEHGGIIKDGAKLVNAMSNSIVPKFTVVVGNSFGAGNYAMCGKAYDPRLIVAWPSAKMAVMGGAQAAKVLLQIQVSAKKKKGETVSEAQEQKLLQEIQAKYDKQTTPWYAAARLWVDEIIDPAQTRETLSLGIAMANNGRMDDQYSTGALQT